MLVWKVQDECSWNRLSHLLTTTTERMDNEEQEVFLELQRANKGVQLYKYSQIRKRWIKVTTDFGNNPPLLELGSVSFFNNLSTQCIRFGFRRWECKENENHEIVEACLSDKIVNSRRGQIRQLIPTIMTILNFHFNTCKGFYTKPEFKVCCHVRSL